jgi:hypothetical protein
MIIIMIMTMTMIIARTQAMRMTWKTMMTEPILDNIRTTTTTPTLNRPANALKFQERVTLVGGKRSNVMPLLTPTPNQSLRSAPTAPRLTRSVLLQEYH